MNSLISCIQQKTKLFIKQVMEPIMTDRFYDRSTMPSLMEADGLLWMLLTCGRMDRHNIMGYFQIIH